MAETRPKRLPLARAAGRRAINFFSCRDLWKPGDHVTRAKMAVFGISGLRPLTSGFLAKWLSAD